MSLPDNPIKKVPKHQMPIGSVKDGKMKVLDGDSGKVSWRSGQKGFSRDYDGDPIASQHNYSDMKKRPKHSAHYSRRPRKPHGV